MVLDDKAITPELKKKFGDLSKQSEGAEAALVNLALQRVPIPRDWPTPVSLAEIQATLAGDDALLTFVHTSTKVYGAVITKTGQQVWVVNDSPALDAKLALLLTQIGLGAAPSLDLGPNVSWRGTAIELSKQLIDQLPGRLCHGFARSEIFR